MTENIFDYIEDNGTDDSEYSYIGEEPAEIIEEHLLPPVITHQMPGLYFTDIMGRTLPVKTVNMDKGHITSVTLTEPIDGKDEYAINEIIVIGDFLPVPGIGYITPGAMVRWHGEDYLLLFGWHTNPSNMTIFSWYLSKDNIAHTVYHEMIDEIDLIGIS